MQLTSHIKVLTNVSEISVPLISYNGKLQIVSRDTLVAIDSILFFNLASPVCQRRSLAKYRLGGPSQENPNFLHADQSEPGRIAVASRDQLAADERNGSVRMWLGGP